jgi:hypothetical protein
MGPPAAAQLIDRQHGIWNQEGITDPDYLDYIWDSYPNAFNFIAEYTEDNVTYYNNTYKFWAMGLLKRSWTWQDYTFADRERVPFGVDWETGKYDLTVLHTYYANRFKKVLRQLATFDPVIPQDVKIIITLFDFHYTGWHNGRPKGLCFQHLRSHYSSL